MLSVERHRSRVLWIVFVAVWCPIHQAAATATQASEGPVSEGPVSEGRVSEGQATDRQALDEAFRQKLQELATKCDQIQLVDQARITRSWHLTRDPRRSYFFTPAAVDPLQPAAGAPREVEQWYQKFCQLRRERAAALWDLALAEVAANNGSAAYPLLYEVLRENPEHRQARFALDDSPSPGHRRSAPKLASIDHPRLGWRKQKYWRHETDHFRISTNLNAKAASELGDKLEQLHMAWRQVFFTYWASSKVLHQRMLGRDEPFGPARHHEVVLFRNRNEYLAAFSAAQPQIDKTLGIYQDKEHTAFFYSGDDSIHGTWYHEATHQLFQEVHGDTPPDAGKEHDTWAVEAIALYMESLQQHSGYMTVGGVDADRLQFARYRALRGDYLLPIEKLTSLGRDALQKDPDISRIYGQSAGVAHFLMDGQSGKLRQPFLQFLSELYLGIARPDSLRQRLNADYAALDAQYREFLQVTDQDIVQAPLSPQLRNLCLGKTSITDRALAKLQPLKKLEWVDLAFTPITDQGISQLQGATKLKQLFLEQTRISDQALQAIGRFGELEELDLSSCEISDDGLKQLTALKKLRKLHLTNCPITDEGLRHLQELKRLDTLELTGTRVTPDGEAVLRLQKALPAWKRN